MEALGWTSICGAIEGRVVTNLEYGDETVDANLREFLNAVSEKFHLEKVILFGSRARGDFLNNSDYDLIIVSSDFAEFSFIERMSEMYKYWNAEPALEAFCYTPHEFARKSAQIGIVGEAVREGIEIAA